MHVFTATVNNITYSLVTLDDYFVIDVTNGNVAVKSNVAAFTTYLLYVTATDWGSEIDHFTE